MRSRNRSRSFVPSAEGLDPRIVPTYIIPSGPPPTYLGTFSDTTAFVPTSTVAQTTFTVPSALSSDLIAYTTITITYNPGTMVGYPVVATTAITTAYHADGTVSVPVMTLSVDDPNTTHTVTPMDPVLLGWPESEPEPRPEFFVTPMDPVLLGWEPDTTSTSNPASPETRSWIADFLNTAAESIAQAMSDGSWPL